MSLTIEELKFLRSINNNNIKVIELASNNNMSTRNIRYKIDNLNFYLSKYINKTIQIEKGVVKVSILESEEERLFNFLDKSILRFSKDERQEIIINMYLFRKDITLSNIEAILGVTRITINQDIKEINKNIINKNIRLELSGKRIALVGNEKKLRHLKAEQLLKYTTIKDKDIIIVEDYLPSKKIIQDLIKEYLDSLPIEDVKSSLEKIQDLLGVKFGKGFYKMILLYLVVTIERIKNNHIITRKNNGQFLENLKQYKILRSVLEDSIDKDYKYEYLHLTEYFISGYSSKEFSKSEFAINSFTIKMLSNIKEQLGSNLEIDNSMVEDILEYLNPAMYRIKNNFTIDEDLDSSKISKDIYDTVENACKKYNDLLPEMLREEEIFYISSLINNFVKIEPPKAISLEELIKIITKNSTKVNVEGLKEDLLKRYRHLIIEDIRDR